MFSFAFAQPLPHQNINLNNAPEFESHATQRVPAPAVPLLATNPNAQPHVLAVHAALAGLVYPQSGKVAH